MPSLPRVALRCYVGVTDYARRGSSHGCFDHPETLKEQVALLSGEAGKSPHAWMVDAIETQAKQAGKRREFCAEARQSRAEYEQTGVSYTANDVHRYILARAAGKKPRRPRPVKR
jgi:hypothetical protein